MSICAPHIFCDGLVPCSPDWKLYLCAPTPSVYKLRAFVWHVHPKLAFYGVAVSVIMLVFLNIELWRCKSVCIQSGHWWQGAVRISGWGWESFGGDINLWRIFLGGGVIAFDESLGGILFYTNVLIVLWKKGVSQTFTKNIKKGINFWHNIQGSINFWCALKGKSLTTLLLVRNSP